jgi:uncharacterized membrane-anchored protein YitT (DUF2179 family)
MLFKMMTSTIYIIFVSYKVQSTVQLKTHKVLANRIVYDNKEKKRKEIRIRKPMRPIEYNLTNYGAATKS